MCMNAVYGSFVERERERASEREREREREREKNLNDCLWWVLPPR